MIKKRFQKPDNDDSSSDLRSDTRLDARPDTRPDTRLRNREGHLINRSLSSKATQPFEDAWNRLFSERIHLDSLLSKQHDKVKSMMAEWFHGILLQPVSFCHRAMISVQPGEPFSLEHLAEWNVVKPLAENWRTNAIRYAMLKEGGSEADFPEWLLAEWKKDWGTETAAYLMDVLSRPAPLTLRKSARMSVEVPAGGKDSTFSPLAHSYPMYQTVRNTAEFLEGKYEIQDEGSQIISLFTLWPEAVSVLLRPQPGPLTEKIEFPLPKKILKVVDACAGAGGKALALADLMKGQGRVFAYDVSLKKLQALARRARRTDLRNIQTRAVSPDLAAEDLKSFSKSADSVLVDAPCSGWGVLRRNPDIKFRQTAAELERLPGIQKELLGRYADLVRTGGNLIYSLCSFRKAETLDVVSAFSESHPEFKPMEGGFLGPGPSDGFFMQRWVRQ